MKKFLVVFFSLLVASAAFAQHSMELRVGNGNAQPANGFAGGGGGSSNLIFHNGGVVIRNAHLVCIFWGPSFNGGSDASYAAGIQAFRNQFGTTPEYNTITQYYGNDALSGYGNILPANLAGGSADWFDTTTPPQNVTDDLVQLEV